MPTTRRQSAIAEGKINPEEEDSKKEPRRKRAPSSSKKGRPPGKKKEEKHEDVEMEDAEAERAEAGQKHDVEEAGKAEAEEPPTKKAKTEGETSIYQVGTIERGHIYFFYRPKVEVEEVHSLDDVRNFHILLVPRPPDFAVWHNTAQEGVSKAESEADENEMKVLQEGADAVPASPEPHAKKQHYRLITIGKKKLPDPEHHDSGESWRKDTFWAIVTAVGDDLHQLEQGLEARSYETKTRGTRHEESARLVARGGYAIVNAEARTSSKRETHLGYHVSHPTPSEFGDVQKSLGIYSASSFILQVKNPLAPATAPQQAHTKGAEYPEWIMHGVFGAAVGSEGEGQTRGREPYGLRFASCETPELLDYKGAELLLIAAREGEEGLETSLGEGRGKALSEKEEEEAKEDVKKVFEELGLDLERFPVESLEGSWI
ncbi:hypothetical protein NLJ89_g9212 [Agrocybe chaxingu]|uniref:Uncharacterized protein n=1 Tax=Agrocybe chaxingu TaxID=84603 RepID=A0A9W8JT60_9AGAR|nr:hypothetical protein NLJ89_g9212 [Agrocybe chaxingu]